MTLDFTEAFGGIFYENRTITLVFLSLKPWSDQMAQDSAVKNALHGRKFNIVFSDDPEYYYVGRVSVGNWEFYRGAGRVTITIDAEPYKYKTDGTVVRWSPEDLLSGDIVTFEAQNEYPVSSLKVNIDPVQDLHGYDAPWPPGGGVNKMAAPAQASQTLGTTICTTDGNGNYTLKATSDSTARTFAFDVTPFSTPAAGYIHLMNNLAASGVTLSLRDANGTIIGSSFPFSVNGRILALSSEQTEQTVSKIYIYKNAATTDIEIVFSPMIMESDVVSQFAPYSNECPISGWTEVNVEQRNKNLWPGAISRTNNGITFTVNDDGSVTCSGTATNNAFSREVRVRNLNAGTYKKPPQTDGIGVYVQYEVSSSSWQLVTGGVVSSDTFTLDADKLKKYAVIVRIRVASGTDLSTPVTFYPYFYLGTETNLTWVSPKSRTYTIQLGQTVYGGTLDVTTGKMMVNKAEADAGALTWTRYDGSSGYAFYASLPLLPQGVAGSAPDFLISNYKAVNTVARSTFTNQGAEATACHVNDGRSIYVKDSNYTDAAAFESAMAGQQIVYTLETPIEIQLDPVQIATLEGINNVWADAGPVDVTKPFVTLSNDAMAVIPTINAEESVTLTWDGGSVSAGAGEFTVPQLVLESGDTEVGVASAGVVTISYREGSL